MTKESPPAETQNNATTQAFENLVQEEVLLQAACWNFQEKLEAAKSQLSNNRQRQAQLRNQIQRSADDH